MFENGSHLAERIVMSLRRIGASVNSAWCEINNRSSHSLLRSALRHSGSCHKAVFFSSGTHLSMIDFNVQSLPPLAKCSCSASLKIMTEVVYIVVQA